MLFLCREGTGQPYRQELDKRLLFLCREGTGTTLSSGIDQKVVIPMALLASQQPMIPVLKEKVAFRES